MMAKLVKLVKYVSIFGTVWYISKEEAESKLETERELYRKWSSLFPDKVQEPRIDERIARSREECP